MKKICSQKVKKQQAPAYNESDIDHPKLFEILREWRTAKATELDVARFQILYQRVLIQIVVCLPETLGELRAISGVGKKTIENYGRDIVDHVCAYRKEHGIETVVLPEPKELPKGDDGSTKTAYSEDDTKTISLNMFNDGKDVSEIAKERSLVNSTIEGHLAFFVENGTLDINKLLSDEQQASIAKELDLEEEENKLSSVKARLGDAYSYGQIKMMAAYRGFLEGKK